MDDLTLNININYTSIWSGYFVKLQHLHDGISLLEIGASNVTKDQFDSYSNFISFYPSSNSKLSFSGALDYAQGWLLRAFLRDSIEITGLFIDDCLSACSAIRMAAKKNVKGSEAYHVLNVLPGKYHKLHFPEKLATLEREFGIASPYTKHILSLNRVRACVVHRLGRVTEQDLNNNNQLVVALRTAKFIARGNLSGNEIVLERPVTIDEDSMVEMRFEEYERIFKLGDQIKLTQTDIFSCIVTLCSFGWSCTEAIDAYARSIGIEPAT